MSRTLTAKTRKTQLAVDYVNEIYEYMRMMERKHAIKDDYLEEKRFFIVPKMRAVLVEWLVEIHHQFSLCQETLYLTVSILDRYLQAEGDKIPREGIQLVGVAAMFIAAKYEELYSPEINDFVFITDNGYSTSQIRGAELKILSALDFKMGQPLPLHFLRRNSKAAKVDATTHLLAKYAMELTLLEYSFVHVLPSEIAAAALAFAMKALDDEGKSLSELWTVTLQYFSQYQLQDIVLTIQTVASVVLNTSWAPSGSKLLAIRRKYSDENFDKIAEWKELTSQVVQNMAKGIF